jgi:F-type H+-transporting ATPase subunit b
MDSLISTFHIDWHLVVAQAINFVVVLLVLYFFALKPLKKLMDERGKTIAGGLENAEKQKMLLAQQQEEYDSALAKARAEGASIMKEAKKDAETKRAELLAKAQEESASVVTAGKAQLEAEKAKMLEDAKKELVSIITTATEKVLGDAVTAKVESKLVEDSIKSI